MHGGQRQWLHCRVLPARTEWCPVQDTGGHPGTMQYAALEDTWKRCIWA